jgi:membrane protein DedA with SNARE-associated domain
MVESFLTPLLTFIEATFRPENPSSLLVLALLAAVTDIGIPIPFFLDTILILTSYNAFYNLSANFLPMILIVVALFVGRQIGSGILYVVARFLGKGFIDWLKRRFPSVGNRLDADKLGNSRWTWVAIVTGRLTPGLLQITSVAAGTIRLRYDYFILGVAVSSLVYDAILVVLGLIAAHSPKSDDINFTAWLLISLVIIVCILWPALFYFLHRSAKKVRPAA